jgi:uncharacterized protein
MRRTPNAEHRTSVTSVLTNTFLHIPGIGETTERALWSSGILSWEDVLTSRRLPIPDSRRYHLQWYVEESLHHLEGGDPNYFAGRMPGRQLWRLFPPFRHSVAYLDIETTGLGAGTDHITTIALYDGRTIRHYVHDRNLGEFRQDIRDYEVVVSYNGRSFDVPFIRNTLGVEMAHAHIDLRYVLHGLGLRGGLKGCERQLGLDRGVLEGVDGYFAVLLWQDYVRNRNERALETLLAYNIQDVVNLETLMVIAYNRSLGKTPFGESHQLEMPQLPAVPFQADPITIERIRARMWTPGGQWERGPWRGGQT